MIVNHCKWDHFTLLSGSIHHHIVQYTLNKHILYIRRVHKSASLFKFFDAYITVRLVCYVNVSVFAHLVLTEKNSFAKLRKLFIFDTVQPYNG